MQRVHWNVSVAGPIGIGLSCGIIFDNGKSMPYLGSGIMKPGVSTSYTCAPGPAASGDTVSLGFTKNKYAAGAINYDTSGNKLSGQAGVVIGVGAKTEFSLTATHTFESFSDLISIPKVY